MGPALSRISSLLLAVGILLTGHGLQLTLLPLRALDQGWTPAAIGLTGSAYFVGFVTGCIVVPRVVSDVGHIRSFMVMAAAATVALLGAGLLTNIWAWLAFRAVTGFALAGLYMVIESWLGDVTPRESRGTILATYSVISLAGMAVGQLLIGLDAGPRQSSFLVAGILLAISIIPVGLTRIGSPHPVPALRFRPRALLGASRVAVVCAGLAGLVTSAFWALGPLLGTTFGIAPGNVGLLMGAGIAGGAMCHLPVGRLSDHFDRRIVIGTIATTGVLVGAVSALYAGRSPALPYLAFFLVGATSMPLYSLCVALACDQSELSLVEVTSGILLINGFASILGPIVASAAIAAFGPTGYFGYFSVCLLLASLWTVFRVVVVERHPEREVDASILPRTTQAIAELAESDVGESDGAA